ncbi:hypothetical protein [Syntrophomonas wolfei]|uniref:BclA C-terminal domain-containing protein n=1 Tax=Syntrophomonas wolfei subsp. wolfei (strain DSM 2245B / Goettingen) TaxID=335541 RepID=Q0AVG6_SYNWW|nr:hypothetical protein [Syntrophomonas wolfei]ABI69288.1 hypothetical protein Swol_1993 [Syntrophomonas wolfei subsp. wolfei str. Goettingen G311]
MDINNGLLAPPNVRYRQVRTGPKSPRGPKTTAGARTIKKGRSENLPVLQDLPSESVASWGYVFQLNTQNVAVGSNITFSNNGPLNGINHTPGTAGIRVTLDGTYNITFSVYTTQNNPQHWGVVVNGVVKSDFNSAGQSLTASTTLTLSALDNVTIRNINTIPDPATLRIGNFTTAYVLLYKVD